MIYGTKTEQRYPDVLKWTVDEMYKMKDKTLQTEMDGELGGQVGICAEMYSVCKNHPECYNSIPLISINYCCVERIYRVVL